MTEPMTPQQLAEADRAAARLASAIDRHAGWDLEADMREVHTAYVGLRGEVDRLARERDSLGTKAMIFHDQRDGAWSTARASAQAILGAVTLCLASSPDNDALRLIAYHARHLLQYAGPPRRPGAPVEVPTVWAVESNHWADVELYAAEAVARQRAEDYVRAEIPVEALEWRRSATGHVAELYGRHPGDTKWLPTSIFVYSMTVNATAPAPATPEEGAAP